jgi:hypothetical protein
VKPPRGLEEIRAFYGDPRPYIKHDGTVSGIWESQMATVPMPASLPLGWNRNQYASRVRVNRVIVPEVEGVFAELVADGLWGLLKTYDGGYTWRLSRGSSRLSTHGFGAALDFDAPWNKLGMEPKMDRRIVRVFERRGWRWGGRWRRKDGMHFQFALGY